MARKTNHSRNGATSDTRKMAQTKQAATTKRAKDRTQSLFTRFACATAHLSGKPATFLLAVLAVVIWAATGPYFGYSDTWQLVINTSTTIVTFLMVFLIQNTQ